MLNLILKYFQVIITNFCTYLHFADEEGVSESHPFYKNIPAGIFGSKKPKSAEEVAMSCNKRE